MKPVNKKERLVSILQFVAIYLIGFILFGLAVSSFKGISATETEAKQQLIDELTLQLAQKDSAINVEKERWAYMINRSVKIDSMFDNIERFSQDLDKLMQEETSITLDMEDLIKDIQRNERGISAELRDWENHFQGGSQQRELAASVTEAYEGSIDSHSALRRFKERIVEEQENSELMMQQEALLQKEQEIKEMERQQQVKASQSKAQNAIADQLSDCDEKLEEKSKKFTEFSDNISSQAEAITTLSDDLRKAEAEIRNFLGNDKEVKATLNRKIDDLNKISADMRLLASQMSFAAQ